MFSRIQIKIDATAAKLFKGTIDYSDSEMAKVH
jgi:hypothetical protein